MKGKITERVLTLDHVRAQYFVYTPENVGCDGNVMPAILVYASGAYTKPLVAAAVEKDGFGALARHARCNVVFMNPAGERWSAVDVDIYRHMLQEFCNDHGAVDGFIEKFNFLTKQVDGRKIAGKYEYLFLYGEGAGADFIAEHLVDGMLSLNCGLYTMECMPTGVALFNTQAVPKLSCDGINVPGTTAVLVNATDAAAAAFEELLAGELAETRLIYKAGSAVKDGFDASLVVDGWERVFSKVRHVGVVEHMYMDRLPDYRSEGIAEIQVKETLSFGEICYIMYIPECCDMTKVQTWPLLFTFHGGGNCARWQAWSSEWPLIGRRNSFMTVAVDQHLDVSEVDVEELLDTLLGRFPSIDPRRIYVSGFSMGSVKSWFCGLAKTARFAGIAPMDACQLMRGFDIVPVSEVSNNSLPIPTFYVAGELDDLVVFPSQKDHMNHDTINTHGDAIFNEIFRRNHAPQFVYDPDRHPLWGMAFDAEAELVSKTGREIAHIHKVRSADGRCYTAFCNVSGQGHTQLGVSCEAAWGFLKQFVREADGSIRVLSES